MPAQLLIGLLIAALIAWAAHRAHSLSRSGGFAAVLIGTLIFGFGGWRWAILLLTFFISSSFLTRAFKERKRDANEKFSKGGERDAAQVLANGGLAAIFACLNAIFPNQLWTWIGFAGALAAVTADTWATELGVLSPTDARMITNLHQRVEKGVSGAVTFWGTCAALLGAALIGLLAAFLSPTGINWRLFLFIAIGGLLGSLFDSFLGATVQAMYFCPLEQKETERHPLHTCGTPTVHSRGWKWLDNDWVNIACSLSGMMLAQVMSHYL
jgi:uncharacterized protein (TIGR00297 family)